MDFDETSSSTFNSNNNNQEGQGESDELLFLDKDFQEQHFFPTKDCILFLIDCSPSMHNLIQDSSNKVSTPISTLLKITENFL